MLGGGYFGQHAPGESGLQAPVVVLDRVLTLILHLEEGVTGGTVLSSKVATLAPRLTAAVLTARHTSGTFPGRVTVAVLPERDTHATLPTRSTRIGDRWLTSP